MCRLCATKFCCYTLPRSFIIHIKCSTNPRAVQHFLPFISLLWLTSILAVLSTLNFGSILLIVCRSFVKCFAISSVLRWVYHCTNSFGEELSYGGTFYLQVAPQLPYLYAVDHIANAALADTIVCFIFVNFSDSRVGRESDAWFAPNLGSAHIWRCLYMLALP